MPTEAYHHGNKVTSCVEVAALMIKPARMQTTLAASFIQIKSFIRMRWLHIYQLSTQPGRLVPVRIDKIERAQLERARKRNTYIDYKSCPVQLSAMAILNDPALLSTPI